MNHELIGVINDDFNYLAHYGVRGMKRGVYGGHGRKYQNHAVYARFDKRYKNSKYGSNKQDSNKGSTDWMKIFREVDIPVTSGAFLLASGLGTANPLMVAAGGVELANATKAIYKAAKANTNERDNDERMNSLKVDNKTGLHLKNENFTKDEDMKLINPGFNNFNNDTKTNCTFCSVAYDLRRRGYDVAANKIDKGASRESFKEWYKNPEFGDMVMRQKSKQEYVKQSMKSLLEQGDGARGALLTTYPRSWMGHAVAYEVDNGQITIRDCQNSKKYIGYDQVSKYIGNTETMTYCRLDNAQINANKIKEAVH